MTTMSDLNAYQFNDLMINILLDYQSSCIEHDQISFVFIIRAIRKKWADDNR